jgi:hypothetical protein
MMADLTPLQNSYAQLVQQITIRLASIIEKLNDEWKAATQEYKNSLALQKEFEKEKKSIVTMEADIAASEAVANNNSKKLLKNPEDSIKNIGANFGAIVSQFRSEYDPLKASIDAVDKQFEQSVVAELSQAKVKVDQLNKEQKRLSNWLTYLKKEIPTEPAEVRRLMFKPMPIGKKIARIKYKPLDIDSIISIIRETKNLFQQRIFPAQQLSGSINTMLDEIRAIIGKIEPLIEKFQNESSQLGKDAKVEIETIHARNIEMKKQPPKK